MQGYGRDESAPTPGGMFATNFVGERNIINKPSAALSQTVSSRRGPIYRARIYLFATTLHTNRNAFTERSQRVHSLYVTYSLCKSMVFAPQKYGFWRAKTPFLHCQNPLFEIPKWGSEFRAYTTILKHRMFFAATQMGGGYVKKMIR